MFISLPVLLMKFYALRNLKVWEPLECVNSVSRTGYPESTLGMTVSVLTPIAEQVHNHFICSTWGIWSERQPNKAILFIWVTPRGSSSALPFTLEIRCARELGTYKAKIMIKCCFWIYLYYYRIWKTNCIIYIVNVITFKIIKSVKFSWCSN